MRGTVVAVKSGHPSHVMLSGKLLEEFAAGCRPAENVK